MDLNGACKSTYLGVEDFEGITCFLGRTEVEDQSSPAAYKWGGQRNEQRINDGFYG